MKDEEAFVEMTRLVGSFAVGAVAAQDFIGRYSNFYYYDALDGHEASSALQPEHMQRLGRAVELHRRIQEEVVNRISLDAGYSVEALKLAGRLGPSEAQELALRICAEVGIEAILSAIRAA
ncbi:hypothetical protein ABH900_001728 [Stenotrophomonas sp. AN71]|uniref:hypothetical protein n=1 Tax=Stenotrophomonas sp. AN71 TaxID=3156253 RepID=UPI003D22B449